MTGRQIYDVLAQQWSDPTHPRMLQVSGLTYEWKSNGKGKAGSIVEGSVKKNELPIDRAASYAVATNDFLATGGDGFSIFTGTNWQVVGEPPLDIVDVLAAYVKSLKNPISAPPLTRVKVQGT
jgi:5'-nucleotidase